MTPDKRLFAQLTAFLTPLAQASGLRLRPFSINLFSMTRLAGMSIGSAQYADLEESEKERQLAALLVIQTTEDSAALGRALRSAAGDFEKFYWEFVFERARDISVENMAAVEEHVSAELPAIEAAQVEVLTPPSLKGGEKPPPNS